MKVPGICDAFVLIAMTVVFVSLASIGWQWLSCSIEVPIAVSFFALAMASYLPQLQLLSCVIEPAKAVLSDRTSHDFLMLSYSQ